MSYRYNVKEIDILTKLRQLLISRIRRVAPVVFIHISMTDWLTESMNYA